MDSEKIYRFAQNLVSEKGETEEVVNWIERSGENRKEFNRIKNLLAYSGFSNFGSLAKYRQQSILFRKTRYLAILKYAAILILTFLIGALSATYINRTVFTEKVAYNEIIVPKGESAEIILADQTHVWLNSGSKLIYPSDFQGKSRNVQLTGEAYFEVKHDANRPFHVCASDLTVEVLGTSFNVEAIENSGLLSVTLVEGKVRLHDNKNRLLAELLPNEKANYDIRERKLDISTVNTVLYTSWKEGVMTFKDEKLMNIAGKLERWFNVEVVFDQPQVKELRFSGAILRNKPIDQVLEILKFTSGIDYSIEIREQQPSKIHLKGKPM
ncbi:MAG: DUF4974 domain-containing protein [Prolixibacteraceae bacterium]|jgi:ferric-dicitrate binding protein FerR (iron transport regulator)|nr:DUF4974 domain-containing protein [Prolixibacteraceae bacterium]